MNPLQRIYRAALLAAGLALAVGCGQKAEEEAAPTAGAGGVAIEVEAEEPVLNVYNWSDYIAEDTIANFEERTGITVNYDVFDSNEVVEAKLLAGNTGYDIVVPSASFLERQIKAGVFQKLDRDKLSNWSNLDEDIMARVALHDPDNQYSAVYMWGTTGIGYNEGKVAEVFPEAPMDSWATLFDPEVISKLSECGVTLLDAPTEVVSAVLAYLGRDPNSETDEDLAAAEEVLMSIRPHIRYIHSSQQINDLANGEICVAMGWSGDMMIAADRASEAEGGVEVAYSIPKEGTVIWFDMLAVPSDAPHPNNAHLFINYLLEPEVIAAVSNYVFYANPNAASTEFVEAEILEDPGIYPPPEVKAKLYPDLAHSAEFTRKLTRTWTRFKTGQ
jgi:putrescine transport system substrate-binding protein